MNKGGVHFIFRSFRMPPHCSGAVKVSGRDEEELLRYAFSTVYASMQQKHPFIIHVSPTSTMTFYCLEEAHLCRQGDMDLGIL